MVQDTPGKAQKPSAPPETSPWAVAGLGMQFFVALIAFVYLGNWVDRRLGTAPIFLLFGLFFGGGGTFFLSYRRLTASTATAPKSGSTGSDPPP